MFSLILPDLALIALGFALSRTMKWGSDLWPGIEKLVYHVLFPALLFHAIVHNPASWAPTRDLVAAVLIVVAASVGSALVARRLLDADPLRHASAAQCGYRFNSYIMLALAQRFGGAEGVALCALCIGVAVPVVNFVAVHSLARHHRRHPLKEWLTNPLILATVGGLVFAGFDLLPPAPVDALLSRIGSAALALGLMSVGAGLRLGGLGTDRPLLAWVAGTKLLLAPAVAVLAGRWLGLAPPAMAALMVFAVVPPSAASYVLATRMGGDGPFVAATLTLTTLASVATMPLWLGPFVAR
ncbi:MAG: AEC family transporter [Lautropia sp.]